MATGPEPILKYLDLLGIPWHSEGTGRIVASACCPIHSERTPSFKIYADGGAYCFGACDRSFRDVVDVIFWREFPADPSLRNAFARAKALNLYDGGAPTGQVTAHRESRRPNIEEVTALDILHHTSHEILLDAQWGAPGLGYLAGRGMRGPYFLAALKTVGFLPQRGGPLLAGRLRTALGQDWRSVARGLGILREDGSFSVIDRVLFFSVARGSALYYQGRTIHEHGLRYLSVARLEKVPYIPLPRAQARLPGTHVVEGPLDAFALAICGAYSLSRLGSHIPDDVEILTWQEPILGYFDHDPAHVAGQVPAGPAAERKLAEACQRLLMDYAPGWLPPGCKDPAKWLETVGPVTVLQQLERVHRWLHTHTRLASPSGWSPSDPMPSGRSAMSAD